MSRQTPLTVTHRFCTTLTVPHTLPDTPPPYRFVTNKGVERFKIVNVVQEKPVLLCEVEVLEEDEDESEDVSAPLLNR